MDIPSKQQQFSDFYEREVDGLFRYISFRVKSRQESMDITQETFCSVWEKIATGAAIISLRAFLYASARNKIIDWYRKKKPLSLESITEGEDGDILPFEPVDALAESRIVLSSEARAVLTLIEKLPTPYRDALYLRLVEEMTPKEIAQVLKVSAGTISVRITRGLAVIRKELGLTQEPEQT